MTYNAESMIRTRKKRYKRVAHFLLVLMCPIWPQLAHLRPVPADFAGTPVGEEGDPASSAAPSTWIPLALSRAMRRSLFFCSLSCSFINLRNYQPLTLRIQMYIDSPYLSASILLGVLCRDHVRDPNAISKRCHLLLRSIRDPAYPRVSSSL